MPRQSYRSFIVYQNHQYFVSEYSPTMCVAVTTSPWPAGDGRHLGHDHRDQPGRRLRDHERRRVHRRRYPQLGTRRDRRRAIGPRRGRGSATRRTAGPPYRLYLGRTNGGTPSAGHVRWPGGATPSGVNKAPSVHHVREIAGPRQSSQIVALLAHGSATVGKLSCAFDDCWGVGCRQVGTFGEPDRELLLADGQRLPPC